MARALPCAAVLVLLLGCGRNHPLQDGTYALTSREVLRDDCGLASQAGVVTSGVLRTVGDHVELTYAYLGTRLVGTYLWKAEKITLDGSALNVDTAVGFAMCHVDSAALHLDTTTATTTQFTGSMSIELTTKGSDDCTCKLWLTVEGNRTGAPP